MTTESTCGVGGRGGHLEASLGPSTVGAGRPGNPKARVASFPNTQTPAKDTIVLGMSLNQ